MMEWATVLAEELHEQWEHDVNCVVEHEGRCGDACMIERIARALDAARAAGLEEGVRETWEDAAKIAEGDDGYFLQGRYEIRRRLAATFRAHAAARASEPPRGT